MIISILCLQCLSKKRIKFSTIVTLDFIGPYNDSKGKPLSENGFRYVLTVIDYFSNYVEAFPLKRKLASEVAEKMYELFCRHGVPM
jgi:hypothetical protein